ncbi:MAG: phosphoenolpyruvate carboxykinase (ATP), partial [Candidatus Kariarchaeaceae archaeon]
MESRIKNLDQTTRPRSKVVDIASTIVAEDINPSDDRILSWIDHKLIPNEKDLYMVKTEITSRSAAFTEIITSDEDALLFDEVDQLFAFARTQDLMMMKMTIGLNDDIKLKVATILPKSHANKALMLRRNFYLSDHDFADSDIISFDMPTYHKRQVIVDPRVGQRVSYVCGIDYYGEQKMSLLRMAMEIMRRDRGGLGLHAGSKTYHLTDGSTKGAIIFGLSGTGKTTLTAHDHGKIDPIKDVDILQDDIVLITPEAKVYGTEYG